MIPGQIAVKADDLWTLLLGYCRYAMGRRSTAPSTADEMVRRYARYLSLERLDQIASEIRSERNLGDECDVRGWIRLAEWIESMRECRSCCGFGYLKRDERYETCDECGGSGFAKVKEGGR